MEVLSAVRSFFPINLKCGISMSLLVISVIHTNTTLKAPRVLLMGNNMLGHLYQLSIGNIGLINNRNIISELTNTRIIGIFILLAKHQNSLSLGVNI